MRALAFMLASYDFTDALGRLRGTMRVATSERTDRRLHSLAYTRLLGFIPVTRIALLLQPVRRNLLQQLRHGRAFPPGLTFQVSFLLRGNAPAVDLVFHALHCSAPCGMRSTAALCRATGPGSAFGTSALKPAIEG